MVCWCWQMSVEVICTVVPGGLRCVNVAEASKLDHMTGKQVSARIYQPRNIKFLKKYFALLKTALDMSDVEMNIDQFRHIVLAGIGHCEFVNHGEKIVAVPKSMSFAKMNEAEFGKIYQDSLKFICLNYVNDTEEGLDQIVSFM
jgi:hypothetical protein